MQYTIEEIGIQLQLNETEKALILRFLGRILNRNAKELGESGKSKEEIDSSMHELCDVHDYLLEQLNLDPDPYDGPEPTIYIPGNGWTLM